MSSFTSTPIWAVAAVAMCMLQSTPAIHAEDKPASKTEAGKSGDGKSATPPKPAGNPSSLITRPLDELMNIQVTSVARHHERRAQAPAAIHVITQEDLRRSGVTSIAEALRLAPGMHVARINSHSWAVSARGFNSEFVNKLLVLMDGRSIYTPLFSGTYWDVQDTMLEDIDRIEVVRGPGATLWGANAVNGVINIITKSAKETQGGLASFGGGTEETGFGSVRYGGKVGKDAYLRGYIKYFDRDDQALPGGQDASDEWRMLRGGFRLDWDVTKDNLLTFQGDAYSGEAGDRIPVPLLTPPFSAVVTDDGAVLGGNVLGRWTHTFSETSNMKLQLYYDRTDRDVVATIEESRDTFDLDFQYRFNLGSIQKVVCGAGYRISRDRIEPDVLATFRPRTRNLNTASAFIQDEIAVLKDTLSLIVGSKVEHNDFTGLEIQPGAKVAWTPHEHHFVWGSVARAVRTPSRAESDVDIALAALPPGAAGPGSPVSLVSITGNRRLPAEKLVACELGYRAQPHPLLSLDFSGFLNFYDELFTVEPQAPFFAASPPPPHLVLPSQIQDKMDGETYGGEAVATWQARKWWRLSATYSYLNMQLHAGRGSTDPNAENPERENPRNILALRSSMDLPHNLELDWTLRYVDNLSSPGIPPYLAGDVRLGWKPSKNSELSIVGQNLFDNQHAEFRPTIPREGTEVQHGAYIKFTLRF